MLENEMTVAQLKYHKEKIRIAEERRLRDIWINSRGITREKIKYKFVLKVAGQLNPLDPHHRLMLGIFSGAVYDLFDGNNWRAAVHYFQRRDFIHLELCGIDPDWIDRLLNAVGIEAGKI